MSKFTILFSLVAFSILFISCEKEDPIIPEEPELITTLSYTLTPIGGGGEIVLLFQDIDGDGGEAPSISSGTLEVNQEYTGTVILLNESIMPAENISDEVLEEDEEHQFFFQSDLPGVSVAYSDQDEDGNPVGLNTSLTTGAAGSGSITIILRHRPEKSASGVSTGDATNAGGETDIEVIFTLAVQ